MALARRDLTAAGAIIEVSFEWAYNIAYNAMLQAGRSYLFHRGYRTAGQGHHATVVEFLQADAGGVLADLVAVMDRMRRNRNRATCDVAGTITRRQAEEAHEAAAELVEKLAAMV